MIYICKELSVDTIPSTVMDIGGKKEKKGDFKALANSSILLKGNLVGWHFV